MFSLLYIAVNIAWMNGTDFFSSRFTGSLGSGAAIGRAIFNDIIVFLFSFSKSTERYSSLDLKEFSVMRCSLC